ncbi:hypothetical protein MAPG_02548 [Magnaporthiopsis poae ATCC 64411]|uniref:Uncharacterized protein n=1 Tax=Magnaporthiopsis poae (strain ATCC 64411 / 73-15) TaxID=644358 RepID=A0A0C4DRN5_MAGP6|nr:hypothetical protein MAPG_02548 [Magnaporthiopsis poae ATCC 64411]
MLCYVVAQSSHETLAVERFQREAAIDIASEQLAACRPNRAGGYNLDTTIHTWIPAPCAGHKVPQDITDPSRALTAARKTPPALWTEAREGKLPYYTEGRICTAPFGRRALGRRHATVFVVIVAVAVVASRPAAGQGRPALDAHLRSLSKRIRHSTYDSPVFTSLSPIWDRSWAPGEIARDPNAGPAT